MVSNEELVGLQETLYTSKNPTRRWLHCSRRDWINNAIANFAIGRGTALEVGPGAGGYLPVLAGAFDFVTAADIEDAYLEHVKGLDSTYPNLKFIVDDITASKLPGQSFDLILCTEVIEHIANSPAALVNLAGLLKQNGVLILSTPQRYSPLEVFAKIAFLPGIIQIVRWIYKEPIIETGHINLLTEGELKTQLSNAGLSIQVQYKSGMYVPLIAEFTSRFGMKFLKKLEYLLTGSAWDWLLWTQYYVLRRADHYANPGETIVERHARSEKN